MTKWKAIKLLTFNKASLSRVLSEIELTHLREKFIRNRSVKFALVPGGGRSCQGSERVFVEALDSTISIFVDVDRGKNPDIIADLTYPWPFREGIFDLIVSTWVLEHLRNPEVFFREAFSVLRDNGIFVCAIPFIYQKHGAPFDL